MGVFEQFPYVNMHEMNLDWLLKKMKELDQAMETFKATESLKFADPIIWDITTQYEKSTIVLDPTGDAYLSLQPVPAGVQLNNDEYWLEIFNFTDYTRTANQNLTVNTETNTTRATAAYQVDDWLIWNDVLYRVTAAIAIDDALIVAPDDGSNIVHFTVEDFIKAFITYATGLIQQYKNDIDASELAYRQQLAQDIANTTASLQAQLDLAISGATVDSEVINARLGADGVTYATLGDAIRTQVSNLTNSINHSVGIYPFIAGYNIATASYNVGDVVDITNLNPDAAWQYVVAPCKPGDVIYSDVTGGSGPRAWNFLDADNKLISKSNAAVSFTSITAPNNAAYVLINDRKLTRTCAYLNTENLIRANISNGRELSRIGKYFHDGIMTIDKFYQGSISQTGEESASTTVIRTDYIPVNAINQLRFNGITGFEIAYRIFADFNNVVRYGNMNQYFSIFINHPAEEYIRFIIRKSDNSAITPSDLENIEILITSQALKTHDCQNDFIINDFANNKMAHASSLAVNDGTAYVAYYANNVDDNESPSDSNIKLYMAHFPICDPTKVTTQLLQEADQEFSNYTCGNRPFYDPKLYWEPGENLQLFASGYENDNTYCIVKMEYDMDSNQLIDHVDKCQLMTEPMSPQGFKTIYDALYSANINIYGCIPVFSSNIRKYSGYYYGVISLYPAHDSQALIVKSTDLINWTIVNRISGSGSTETALATDNSRIYTLSRGSNSIEIFNISDGSSILTESQNVVAKPQAFVLNDRIYFAYNTDETVVTSWGTLTRAVMIIENWIYSSSTLKRIPVMKIRSTTGINYPSFHNYAGTLYMTYTCDRIKMNVNNLRSNIAFTEIEPYIGKQIQYN